MLAFPALSRFWASDSFAVKCRLLTLTAYGGSLIFLHHTELLAEKVYNDLCSNEGIRFSKPMSATNLVLVMAVFSVPTLLARSRALIMSNLAVSMITVGSALLLLFTASDMPYECFTMGGDYEDHTSGLGEFMLWGCFVLLLSFVSLFIDLSIWASRKVAVYFK
jgi:hypothetical protein